MAQALALAMDFKAEVKSVPLGPFAVKKGNKSQYIGVFML